MTITSLAPAASQSCHITGGFSGDIPVDVLVEGRAAERTARHILQRLLFVLPKSPVLHDEALLYAGRSLDDLITGIAQECIPFLTVSVGRQLAASSGSSTGISLVDPADHGVVVPSVVIVARGDHIVGVATAVAAAKGPDSLVAATVSSARSGLSTVLARHVLTLGPLSAEPLLRMSDASGIAISASGAYMPC